MEEFPQPIKPEPAINAENVVEEMEKTHNLALAFLLANESLSEKEAQKKLEEMTAAEMSDLADKARQELKNSN